MDHNGQRHMDMDDMDMDSDSMSGGDMDMGNMFMMKMWFHGGTMEKVAFDFWEITDDRSMTYSWFIIFILAFLYEGLKYFRDYLYARFRHRSQEDRWATVVFSFPHLLQTFLHALQYFVSYLLMLIFMTYNSWLCLAVILGAALGYFTFGWKKNSNVEISDHCH